MCEPPWWPPPTNRTCSSFCNSTMPRDSLARVRRHWRSCWCFCFSGCHFRRVVFLFRVCEHPGEKTVFFCFLFAACCGIASYGKCVRCSFTLKCAGECCFGFMAVAVRLFDGVRVFWRGSSISSAAISRPPPSHDGAHGADAVQSSKKGQTITTRDRTWPRLTFRACGPRRPSPRGAGRLCTCGTPRRAVRRPCRLALPAGLP